MIKWFFKWVFRLFFLAFVLAIILLLSLNSIVRILIEHNIREQTGMDAEIGRLEIGWAEPTFEIQDMKIYNSLAFGGTPYLDIPEMHIEYDRAALLKGALHLRMLRLNLSELDIVQNRNGQINIFASDKVSQGNSGGISANAFKKQTGYDFEGIDSLVFSFDKVKFIDLQNRHNDRERTIGLQNCVVPDVKSMKDLAGLIFIIEMRSNHFFDPLIAGQVKSAPVKGVLNIMGAAL